MTQQEGEVVSEMAVHVVHVAVADPAGCHTHQYFPRTGIPAAQFLDPEGPALGYSHHTTPNSRTHIFSLRCLPGSPSARHASNGPCRQ